MNIVRDVFRYKDEEIIDPRPAAAAAATACLDLTDFSRMTVEQISAGSTWSGDSSLETLLRRRVRDLEQIEEHLRRQVLNLPSYKLLLDVCDFAIPATLS